MQQHRKIRISPQLPDVPPAYTAYKRCQKWGFPLDGGWVDQPAGYMQDVWAAEEGVLRFQSLQTSQELVGANR